MLGRGSTAPRNPASPVRAVGRFPSGLGVVRGVRAVAGNGRPACAAARFLTCFAAGTSWQCSWCPGSRSQARKEDGDEQPVRAHPGRWLRRGPRGHPRSHPGPGRGHLDHQARRGHHGDVRQGQPSKTPRPAPCSRASRRPPAARSSSGSGLPGSHAGSLSAVGFTTCTGPGGCHQFTLRATDLPWHVNLSSYNAATGVVTRDGQPHPDHAVRRRLHGRDRRDQRHRQRRQGEVHLHRQHRPAHGADHRRQPALLRRQPAASA